MCCLCSCCHQTSLPKHAALSLHLTSACDTDWTIYVTSYTLQARGADTVLVSFSRLQTCTRLPRSRCTHPDLAGCRVLRIGWPPCVHTQKVANCRSQKNKNFMYPNVSAVVFREKDLTSECMCHALYKEIYDLCHFLASLKPQLAGLP